MEEKVSNLFDDESTTQPEQGDVLSKVNAIESIADDAVETELELPKAQPTISTPDGTMTVEEPSPKPTSVSSNKMWTLAVVASVLILLASAGGMIFILLKG